MSENTPPYHAQSGEFDDNLLVQIEHIAANCWQESEPIEEKVRAYVRAYLDQHGCTEWQIGAIYQHRLPDGTPLFSVSESLVRQCEHCQYTRPHPRIYFSHDLVLVRDDTFIILEPVLPAQQEGNNHAE